MADRISDNAINFCVGVDMIPAVKLLKLFYARLPRSGRCGIAKRTKHTKNIITTP